ncbi:ras guanine-nucleotide exchange protein-like protein [Xylogone sp. PMI_703]|nr:ras guanine-nucleotide exchange protein-like protein [Xylogone sp. PMI_703]
MVTAFDYNARSSVHVAPLAIHKHRPRNSSKGWRHQRNTSTSTDLTTSTTTSSQITPPTTPNGSQEDLLRRYVEPSQPVFHNFLRAFYPFQPTPSASETTVTVPLSEGDLILVHSIHTNGWADGTLLPSGARGWLPTNYCTAYEPESMQNLLVALLNFWDLLRHGVMSEAEVIRNQEIMRGVIAGVRYLLEKSNCLTRESPLVQSCEALKRSRKALLSELSSLVKSAKKLQDIPLTPTEIYIEEMNNTIDDMIIKAFKLVVRGVRFLDAWEDEMSSRTLVHVPMTALKEEGQKPLTPPSDASFDKPATGKRTHDMASRRMSTYSCDSGVSSSQFSEDTTKCESYKRMSIYSSTTASSSRPLSISRPASLHVKRQSISHRMSMSMPAAQRQNLVSERLNACHDTFLSYLGSFIGRLHLQSQSSAGLLLTTRESVNAGSELLGIIDTICAHDGQSADTLHATRNALYDHLNKLETSAKDIIHTNGFEEDDVVMPHQNGSLLMAATACVKAAGECVAKSRFVIERIGDFEFERNDNSGLGPDEFQAIPNNTTGPSKRESLLSEPTKELPQTEPTRRPSLAPANTEKPLPELPPDSPINTTALQVQSSIDSQIEGPQLLAPQHNSSQPTRTSSLLPPLPKLITSGSPLEEPSLPEESAGHGSPLQDSFSSRSIATSTTSSASANGMQDSEMTGVSTRATTPASPALENKPSISSINNMTTSQSLRDAEDDGESKVLEKTFAHELMHNKDGQVTGGTLAALVEKLTTHDSTPDAMFVTTFHLTFRLFVSPVDLAKALIERFDYVAESPHIASPVRLRVYNVFKVWMESHWHDASDHDALAIIESFAEAKLKPVLPAAAQRLQELSQKVSSSEGYLVPRQVSSMGKTSTGNAASATVESPIPPVIFTKSQMGLVRNWKMGGTCPTITDFDPLEIARQLAIKEMNIFCAIMPEELLGSEWTKKSGSNAPNVRAMSTLSTDLSNLVADTILQHEDVKKRALTIKHWIKIAHRCLELNNYHSLMAIICSLNSSTIVRLRRTWDYISQKRKDTLTSLQAIVEPDKNYAVLRKRLHNHVAPCLPFVGLYLTDLTFIDAGNPATKQLPGIGDSEGTTVINFDKHTRTAKIIGELQRFQIPYRLAEVTELQEWLQAQIVRVKSTSEHEHVTQFYRKSLLLEPRETVQKQSPVEATPASASSKEKFDIFGWTHLKVTVTS